MWPPPKPVGPPLPSVTAPVSAAKVDAAKTIEPNYFMNTFNDAAKYSAGKNLLHFFSVSFFDQLAV